MAGGPRATLPTGGERTSANRGRRPLGRWILVLLATFALTMSTSHAPLANQAMASPQDSPNAEPSPEPKPSGSSASVVPTMVILDASGSMNETDGDDSGSTRMQVARDAATDLVDEISDDAELGLTVYGANTGNTAADRDAGCEDVEVVAPVDSGNSAELKKAINSMEASGYTPIGKSLRDAADAMPGNEGSIVLVSDGIDECAPPPPCDVAEELNDEGFDLTIHTIGFRVPDEAREDLTCIADKTGGSYSDAQDGEDLTEQLITRATRALQGYEVGGIPIEGGPALHEAAPIEPGEYLDEYDPPTSENSSEDGLAKYYEMDIAEGERLHVTGTVVPPPVPDEGSGIGGNKHLKLQVDILDAQGESCSGLNDFEMDSPGRGHQPLVVEASSEPAEPEGEDSWDTCAEGPVYIEVARDGKAFDGESLPVELMVAVEPADLPAEGTPPEKSEKIEGPEPGDSPDEVTELGRSYADAPVLEPGTYAIEMVPGDFGSIAVEANEGQTLSWRMEVDDRPDSLKNTFTEVTVRNPLRQVVQPDGSHFMTSFDKKFAVGGTAAPISYGNKDVRDNGVSSAWLGGRQTIDFWYGWNTKADAKEEVSRFLLTIEVDGEAGENPELVTEPAPPENPDVDENSGSGSVAGGDAPEDAGSASGSVVADAATQDSGGLPWARIGLLAGASVVVFLGLGAAIWRTRRSG